MSSNYQLLRQFLIKKATNLKVSLLFSYFTMSTIKFTAFSIEILLVSTDK